MAKSKKGFTIIEVVLVLAIAGLIFLMVFIALPALQRSQRNTQREDDISRFLTAANDYQTNNHGKSPFKSDGYSGVDKNFVTRYIDSSCTPTQNATDGSYSCTSGDEFTDPDGNVYSMSGKAWTSTDKSAGVFGSTVTFPNNHLVQAITKATCGDENIAEEGTGERQYALFYMLEGNSVTCNDNH